MNIPPVPSRQQGLTAEQRLEQVYDYLQGVDRELRVGPRFGWPLNCSLLLAQSTSAPGALAVPAFVNATGLYQQIALSWDLETSPALLDYEVSKSTSSGGALTVIGYTPGNSFLDWGLADSTAYFYKIQARLLDGSTYSGYSAEVTATTLANDTTADAQLAVALRKLQDNTHRVNLASGVTGILPVVNGGTGQAVGAIAIMQFIGAAVPQNATSYLGRDDSAVETDICFVCPVTGVLAKLAVSVMAAPPAGQTFTYRVMIAGAASSGNAIITSAGPTVIVAPTGSLTAGDTISVRCIASVTAGVTDHAVTVGIRVDG